MRKAIIFLLNFATACFLLSEISYAQANYAISLPGGTDGNLSNIDISGLNLKTLPYSIEMWIKPVGSQVQYAGLMYHRGTGNSGIQYAATWQGNDKIRIMSNITSDYGTVSGAVSTDTWHHLAVVVTSATRTIYLDGVASTQSISNTVYDFSSGKLYIGWDNAGANRIFKGLIDEVRVWNTARTSRELDSCKFKILAGNETGLIGYWNFDDQSTTATDITGHVSGIINGGAYTLSPIFDPMVLKSSGMSQNNSEVNSPSVNNVVACLKIQTANPLNPLKLTNIYLNTNGTTSVTDISKISIYSTGNDSTFNTATLVATIIPQDTKYTVNCNRELKEGSNYFWIAYDVQKNVPKGSILDAECDSFTLAGADTNIYIPSNAAPVGAVTVNPDMYMPNVKLPAEIVTNLGQTPSGGANFVSFQQNAITTYKGYQYVTYWNNAFHVCVARKKLPVGAWEIVEFTDYTVTAARIGDNHYNISIGVCPNDGTIHVAFDHHGDILHYRKSVKDLANKPETLSWSASSFGARQDYLIPGQQMTQVTYPRFVAKPNGDLLYEYRYGTSGAGDSYIYEYTASTGTWSQIGKYLDGLTLNNNGYLNGIHYDRTGRLHASWVWRETPDPFTNHDVCYMYSDDDGRTWMSHNGLQVGSVNTNPVKSNTSGIQIWSIGQKRGLINQESQVTDSKGGIHILQSYLKDSEPNSTNFWNDRARAYLHHLYKDENGIWQSDIINAVSINRSQIAIDEGDNLYVVSPNYRVYYASATEKWKKWTVFDLSESTSAINEGLIDRESLLNESVLSFVFAQTGGKIFVPYYLIDKSKPGKGTGLNVSLYGDTNYGSLITQKLDSVNLNSSNVSHGGDSVSVRYLGTLETKYAESYTLQFSTSGNAKVWINELPMLNTGNVSGETTFPVLLNLQPSHKYRIKIEGKYATANVLAKLEWESERQVREVIPLSSLYGTLAELPSSLAQVSSGNFEVKCYPNPFKDNAVVNVGGQFSYKLYDIRGAMVRKGQAEGYISVGEGLRNGVYILEIIKDNRSKKVKLMKL